jgi:hypothetical protein
MLEEKEAEKVRIALEKEEEDSLKKRASDELKKYSQSEPATILQENEKATHDEIKSMNSDMSKLLEKKAETLVADFLKDPSSLLSA